MAAVAHANFCFVTQLGDANFVGGTIGTKDLRVSTNLCHRKKPFHSFYSDAGRCQKRLLVQGTFLVTKLNSFEHCVQCVTSSSGTQTGLQRINEKS
jgi:hypothetical protein